MSVSETEHSDKFVWNRQVYHRLKLALSLGLRRQIFLAVCDDLNLRNKIAARLHSTLAYPVGQVLYQAPELQEASTPAYPRLVTLRLNNSDPNPVAQINQWLLNYPPPIVGASKDSPGRMLPIPSFQIVGVEQLTRQPVAIQRLFLHYLRLIEQHLVAPESSRFLETSLLLWVPRPWLHAIQQSAPQFWRSRTGVFVFAGEPTPTNSNRSSLAEGFAASESLDLDAFEQSVLQEEFDFQPQLAAGRGQTNEAPSADRSEISIPEAPPTELTAETDVGDAPASMHSNHISKELKELILATINSTSAENAEEIKQLLEEINLLHSQKASPQTISDAYQRLGNLYRLRIERGQTTLENLMVAILAYQEAIAGDETSPQVPDILNDLGTLYWMLYRTPPNGAERQSYIQQGIEFYQLALKLISPETQPETYARVQNNLGTAYGDLARFTNPAENWQQAIAAYSEALRFCNPQMEPAKYAANQNNLGTAYWHLAQHSQPIENLHKAIAAYNQAVQHYQPEQEPLKYGMIQNNIGTARWNLSQYENPAENLRLAIQAYEEALKYRTPARLPAACAATQNNLGTAWWHLANQAQIKKEQQQKFLNLCIHAYSQSLALAASVPKENLSFDVFATYNHLGLAHYQLATEHYLQTDKASCSKHLEAALENHLQALNGFREQPQAYQISLAYVLKTIRAFHAEFGIKGQNLALSKVPGPLLPEILAKL